MTQLPEKLRLKGLAEEDIYFARRDRELIEALRKRRDSRDPEAADNRVAGDGDARLGRPRSDEDE